MFVIHPHFARESTPGQVPKLDPALAYSPLPQYDLDVQAGPTMRAEGIVGGLGLPRELERSLSTFARAEASAAVHEIDFRQAMMTRVRSLEPALRHAIMSRALSYYRGRTQGSSPHIKTQTMLPHSRLPNVAKSQVQQLVIDASRTLSKAALGGKYHRRVPKPDGGYKYIYSEEAYARRPDAHLDGLEALKNQLRRLLGRPAADFGPLVARHGAALIGSALRSLGAQFEDGKIVAGGGVAKALPVQGTGHMNAAKLPPGTRRVWHNRIVERFPDDKWHVVGHIAGLEDPKKPPLLQHQEISHEDLRDLIEKIRKVEALEARLGAKAPALVDKPAGSKTPPKLPPVPGAPAPAPASRLGQPQKKTWERKGHDQKEPRDD